MTEQISGKILDDAQAAMKKKRGRAWAFPVIKGHQTALIACEVSRLGLALAPKMRATIPRIDWLARTLRAADGLVFWSHFSSSAFDGPAGDILGESDVTMMRQRLSNPSWTEVSEGIQNIDSDLMVARRGYSALTPELRKTLLNNKIDTVFIVGAETDGAVDSTARDAASAGMRVIIVGDCCTSSDEAAHTASLAALHRRIGDVRSVDELITELRRSKPS